MKAGKRTHLGYFDDEEEAARAYDVAAARLGRPVNFPAADSGARTAVKGLSSRFKGVTMAPSRFKGVSWDKARGKCSASIWKDGKRTHLGCFDDEEEAARAYDVTAARLGRPVNFPAADSGAHAAVKGGYGGSLRCKNTFSGKLHANEKALLACDAAAERQGRAVNSPPTHIDTRSKKRSDCEISSIDHKWTTSVLIQKNSFIYGAEPENIHRAKMAKLQHQTCRGSVSLIGCQVVKLFPGFGHFAGTVTGERETRGVQGPVQWVMVSYDDGDAEEYERVEIESAITAGTRGQGCCFRSTFSAVLPWKHCITEFSASPLCGSDTGSSMKICSVVITSFKDESVWRKSAMHSRLTQNLSLISGKRKLHSDVESNPTALNFPAEQENALTEKAALFKNSPAVAPRKCPSSDLGAQKAAQ